LEKVIKRKQIRLRDYDYSQNGYYFVTVCTRDRKDFFGDIKEGKANLNRYGETVNQCWRDLPRHYRNCSLDSFVIMPNHVHGIILIDNGEVVGNGLKPFPTHGLPEIIRGFKTFSSRKINEKIMIYNRFQWQKSFYDHVIRNERSLENLRQYIMYNPLKWELDIENRAGIPGPAKGCKRYYEEIIDGR
jgi:REP element-mobilizing transposase RayT